jgi:hypothetical protein
LSERNIKNVCTDRERERIDSIKENENVGETVFVC